MRLYLWLAALLILTPSPRAEEPPTHALSLLGKPKYPPRFTQFGYANKDAPRGGTLRLAALGGFDNLNPFTIKGRHAASLGLALESLMTGSLDEPASEYGLIAESVEVAADRKSVLFTLREEARFHNGAPITAQDVLWSFQTLREQNPFYRAYYADVVGAEAETPRRVRFAFADGRNKELPLILGQFPILSKKDWADRDVSKTSLTIFLGSGAYKIGRLEAGRFIDYVRVKDYWGRDLPVNRGRNHFDRIRISYFGDDTVALEAFKGKTVDFRLESSSKNWATAYDALARKNAALVLEEIPDHRPAGMQAFIFNLRRQFFQDARTRQAFNLAMDFHWMNKNLFYGQYERTESFFDRSELAAKNLPLRREMKLLSPFRDRLPKALFERPYRNPTGADMRKRLREAKRLLAQAGWHVKEGVLTDRNGREMRPEFLLVQPSFERVVLPFMASLRKLGVHAAIRVVDSAQYRNRIQNYDFDVIVGSFPQSLSPGNEQRDFWGSAAADRPGGRNLAGIKDPIIDALIETVIAAPTRADLIAATRALDRVLLWNHYVLPQWHSRAARVAYWKPLRRPDPSPRYGLGFPDFWWHDAPRPLR